MSATWKDLLRELDLAEKLRAASLASMCFAFSGVLVAVILRAGGVAGETPFVVASVPAFLSAGLMLAALVLDGMDRRAERRRVALLQLARENRIRWEQVGALHFRKVEDVHGGALVLEELFLPDTPDGRLKAKDFAGRWVRGPRVRHTREVGQ